jgi:hypothetical protein
MHQTRALRTLDSQTAARFARGLFAVFGLRAKQFALWSKSLMSLEEALRMYQLKAELNLDDIE